MRKILKSLRIGSPEVFERFVEELEAEKARLLSSLLTCKDFSEIRFLQGRLFSLNKILEEAKNDS